MRKVIYLMLGLTGSIVINYLLYHKNQEMKRALLEKNRQISAMNLKIDSLSEESKGLENEVKRKIRDIVIEKVKLNEIEAILKNVKDPLVREKKIKKIISYSPKLL